MTDFDSLFKATTSGTMVSTHQTRSQLQFAATFSEYIGAWNMSGAQIVEQMFRGNQHISGNLGIHQWDMSHTRQLKGMFMDTEWIQPALSLASWNSSGFQNLENLFQNSSVTTAGVANWDTGKVLSLYRFAYAAPQFNENISGSNAYLHKWQSKLESLLEACGMCTM